MYNNLGSWIEREEERQVVVGVGCGGCYREDGPEKPGGASPSHMEKSGEIFLYCNKSDKGKDGFMEYVVYFGHVFLVMVSKFFVKNLSVGSW